MIRSALAAYLFGAFVFAGACSAASTSWMSKSQMDSFVSGRMAGGKAYATGIGCKESASGPMLRMSYSPFPKGYIAETGTSKFFRWNWVMGKSTEISGKIAKLHPKEKPQLKWRIVSQASYVDGAGTKMTCAVIYR